MLSVRSRDEGRGFGKERRKGLGFGGAEEMEESELEEGEACSYRNEDRGVHEPDVDVDLSYIDHRIEDVLGHFQKDFEGIVSLENLGAKFGDYGSFLPAHQRPPILLQPGGSARVQHSSTPSQGDQPSESTRQNLTHQASASLPARSIPSPTSTQIVASMTSLDASITKEILNTSGFRYDPINKCIDVDPQVWSEYIEKYPNKKKYKGPKLWRYYDEFVEVYGDSYATSKDADTCTSMQLDEDTKPFPTTHYSHMQPETSQSFTQMLHEDSPPIQSPILLSPTTQDPRSATNRTTSRSKRTRPAFDDKYYNLLHGIAEDVKTMSSTSRGVQFASWRNRK